MKFNSIGSLLKLSICPFILLVGPACMVTHSMSDHHGKRVADQSEIQEGSSTRPYKGPEDLPDKGLRTDKQGGLFFEIQFKQFSKNGELDFAVRISNHVIDTNQFELDKLASLANDRGIEVRGIRWHSINVSPQRVSGDLYFPGKDSSGNLLIFHGIRNLVLKIKDMGGIPERVFLWELSHGQQKNGEI